MDFFLPSQDWESAVCTFYSSKSSWLTHLNVTTAKEKEQSNTSYADAYTTKPKEAHSSWN